MLEKLKKIKEEYQEIEKQLSEPEVTSDQARYKSLSRKYKELSYAKELCDQYELADESKNEAEKILKEEKDPELVDMAKMQLEAQKALAQDDRERDKMDQDLLIKAQRCSVSTALQYM